MARLTFGKGKAAAAWLAALTPANLVLLAMFADAAAECRASFVTLKPCSTARRLSQQSPSLNIASAISRVMGYHLSSGILPG